MPRPKVPESLRQRAAEACSFCREAKKRCSGSAPCTQCVRRGLERDCCMTELPRGSRTRKISKSSAVGATRRSRATPALDNESITVSVSSPVSPRDRSRRSFNGAGQRQLRLSPPASQQEDEDVSMNVDPRPLTPPRETSQVEASSSVTDPSLLANPSRMLRSLHGEQVYVGGAAAISFLQTVRQVVAGQIGPSPFSHNDDTETMLEVESPETRATTSPSADTVVDLNVQQKLAYLHCYYSATEGLIDIFDPSERQQLFHLAQSQSSSTNTSDSRPSTPPNILPDAIREMVIAIGAQCSSASEAQTIGRSCFRRAQRQAFAELLEDPDLHMVRLFLLMAFYMLGECRRNTAYMYLSIAARAALALGLHSPSSFMGKPDQKGQLRLRVWISVRILDKLVNSLLGRPAATAGVQTDIRAALGQLPPHPDDYATQCLVATCAIVDIINEINNTLYHDKDVSATVVEHLLLKIDTWKRSLPPSLKGSLHHQLSENAPDSSSSTQRVAIAKIHVSCLYYFAVTLATRPVFIASLNSNRPDAKIHHPPLAAACIDAAVYLAQTCADALKAGLLQRSMCIMKALVFAAGLVLGVENFAKSAIDIETDRAFQGAIDVLAFLAAQSHQAAHYLEILTSLSNAISERRSKPAPVGGSRYVSKLFSLDPPPCQVGSTSSGSGTSGGSNMVSQRYHQQGEDDAGFWPLIRFEQGGMVGEGGGISDGLGGAGDPGSWPEVQLDDDDLSIDWESLNIFQWDSFPFNA